MRHAEARRDGAFSDADRPLTAAGESQADVAGVALTRLGVRPAQLCTSPALRCRQTAVPRQTRRVCEALAGGADVERLLHELAEAAAGTPELLVIGHEPEIAAFGSRLLCGTARASLRFEPSSCACFEVVDWPQAP